MKFLKKASLAASIAAVSFAANAELVAMDESALAAATGQAGIDLDVTLEGTSAISIGEILYTDTDTGGGVSISNLTLGSADGSAITLYNKIDVEADGSLTIDSTATNLTGMLLHIDSVNTVADGGAVAANLVGATDLYMNIVGGTTTIAQSGTDTTITMTGGSVEVTSDLNGTSSSTLLNGAITASDIKVYGSGGVGSGISTDATLLFNNSGVSITGLDLAGTIEIGDLALGGSSIGSVAISDIALNGASITISGR